MCELKEPTILAGMPFMIEYDIAVRPAKSQIIIGGTDIVEYDTKAVKVKKHSHSRRITNLIRSPTTSVILPGDRSASNYLIIYTMRGK